MNKSSIRAALFAATALTSQPAFSQSDCAATPSAQECRGNAVTIERGANTEAPSRGQVGPGGFSFAVNGKKVVGDSRVDAIVRRTDLALARADVQVVFDGLGAKPRLNLRVDAPARAFDPAGNRTFRSEVNYPAFVKRAEVRIIDLQAPGGARTVATAPIEPNGSATIAVPEGGYLVAVHRVYDAAGRYDETRPLPLGEASDAAPAGVEEGVDATAVRGIAVNGGAITVRGRGLVSGAVVQTLGERVSGDASGGFVVQRIVPPGNYGVEVIVNGPGQRMREVREITVPGSEWFRTGVIDLTHRVPMGAGSAGTGGQTSGRVAFYVDGRTSSGWQVTASADTGEGDVASMLRRLEERDPRSLVARMDPGDLYPTYGDGSTATDKTPTSGRIFLRAERDGTYVQWGDFKGNIRGDQMVRNERRLYGLSAGAELPTTTASGEARGSIAVYAAQPRMAPQRDVFLGTGGTSYFLTRQDISQGSETVSVQVRDKSTGRILSTRLLGSGTDYTINAIQGVVTLANPVSDYGSDRFGGMTTETVVVVQYEYSPSGVDPDGMAYGGRAEGWVTDQLRLGVTSTFDGSGATDHRANGVDLLYQLAPESWLKAEVATSEGTGPGSTYSADGGLVTDNQSVASGSGRAVKLDAKLTFADVGLAGDGTLKAYYEQRSLGFATLDRQVTAATGDEELHGLALDMQAGPAMRLKLAYDSYANAMGERNRKGRAEAEVALTDATRLTAALGQEDIASTLRTGTRTTAGLRIDHDLGAGSSVYAFGKTTLQQSGLGRDDRYGLGGKRDFGNGWSLSAEVSDGVAGPGGRLAAGYQDDRGNSRYLGYSLDPTREVKGVTLEGQDQGAIVAGARQTLSETTTIYGENTYDLFGDHRSLATAYGLTYAPRDQLSYTFAVKYGTVSDAPDQDFKRTAITFGVRMEDQRSTASGRIEYRAENGLRSGDAVDSRTLLLSGKYSYRFDDARQLHASAELARTYAPGSPLLDGDYADLRLGYALRPVTNDRLNLLARYRYLDDEIGQRLNGTDRLGPVQRTHVISVDATYELTRAWTVGGKLGYRLSESAPDSNSAYSRNDAVMAVVNARWHIVHDWDALIEARQLTSMASGTSETGALAAVYKHFGNNLMLGVGYNFGQFSDDLTDLTRDDAGAFVNLVAKF